MQLRSDVLQHSLQDELLAQVAGQVVLGALPQLHHLALLGLQLPMVFNHSHLPRGLRFSVESQHVVQFIFQTSM